MKKVTFLALMVLMTLGMAQLLAQDKKKKKEPEKPKEEKTKPEDPKDDEPAPVFNYVIDDPMDTWGPKQGEEPAIRYFLLPEFYTYWPVENNDTVYKYDCYDVNHDPMIVDTLSNMNDAYYISLMKIYRDYLHTNIDAEGKPRPQPVASALYRYERTSTNSWKAFDVVNNFTFELEEEKSRIVKTDTTVVVNSVTGNKQTTIRKYYKVTETNKTETAATDKSTTSSTVSVASVTTFLVPEFYFGTPKIVNDTTLEFRCYDVRDSLIPVVTNFDSVRYFSLFKSYTDNAHTYVDKNGEKKPLPVSSIIKRYDHIAKDKWMSVEYPGNKYTQLKGFRESIVTSDTTIVVDPVTGTDNMHVYNYYKVIKN